MAFWELSQRHEGDILRLCVFEKINPSPAHSVLTLGGIPEVRRFHHDRKRDVDPVFH